MSKYPKKKLLKLDLGLVKTRLSDYPSSTWGREDPFKAITQVRLGGGEDPS